MIRCRLIALAALVAASCSAGDPPAGARLSPLPETFAVRDRMSYDGLEEALELLSTLAAESPDADVRGLAGSLTAQLLYDRQDYSTLAAMLGEGGDAGARLVRWLAELPPQQGVLLLDYPNGYLGVFPVGSERRRTSEIQGS